MALGTGTCQKCKTESNRAKFYWTGSGMVIICEDCENGKMVNSHAPLAISGLPTHNNDPEVRHNPMDIYGEMYK